MKCRHIFLTILIFTIFGTTTVQAQSAMDSKTETEAVEATIKSFFDAMSDFDYQEMRDLTSQDFTLIENGPVWTLDDLIARAKQGEENGATLSYKFAEMETTVNESTAWMTYKNHGVMAMGGKETAYNWTESAVLQKMEDEWKIVLLHSTMNEAGSNHGEE